MKSHLIGTSLIICDTIILDSFTRKHSLVGIFNTLQASAFPLVYPQLAVFAQLTGGKGTERVTLRCVATSESLTILESRRTIQFPNPGTVVELQFVIHNLTFPGPDLYAFQLHCGGQPILEARFNVIPVASRVSTQ